MEAIEESLTCVECHEQLDTPVLLTCGESVCRKHIVPENKQHYCVMCQNLHEIPADGFAANKALAKIIKTRIQKVKLTDEYEYAYVTCKKLKTAVDELSQLQKNPYFYINKVIGQLKVETDQIRDEFKARIDQMADELMDKLVGYESECKESLDASVHLVGLRNFDQNMLKIKQQLDEWKRTLGTFDTNEADLRKIANKGMRDSAELEAKIGPFKVDCLLNKLNEYQTRVREFAQLDFNLKKKDVRDVTVTTTFVVDEGNKLIFDSKILNNSLEKQLVEVCEFSSNQKWRLLYRASEQGFGSKDFHKNCDNYGQTLTIIKSTSGFIFGGYNQVTWDLTSESKPDYDAFLFSLVNRENKPIKMKITQGYEKTAIDCGSNSGPTFGVGNDLFISSHSNANMLSFSNLCYSYKHPSYGRDSKEAKAFLAGSNNFSVVEIEVYHKQ